MAIAFFIVLHWYLSLFSQTFFHHRYAAHSQFTMSKAWEKVFFVYSFIVQGSSYLSPYAYGILHRIHHAFTDTEKDPHSPSYDKSLMAMMWRTKDEYLDILYNRVEIEDKFKKNLPEWHSFDRFCDHWVTRITWGVAYTAFYVYFAPVWWVFLFLPLHYFMGPIHGAIINWFAHKYGYTNFPQDNTSKNFLPVDFLMLGESYHNNHHKFASRPNFGYRWFEIDPVYPVILLLNKLGVVHLKKAA